MNRTPPSPDFGALAAAVPRGGHIVVHSDFAEPVVLVEGLMAHAERLDGVTLHTLMPVVEPLYAKTPPSDNLGVEAFFPGPGLRKAINKGWVRPRRCVLSDIPQFFSRGEIRADLLLLQVSLPDAHGRVSLGVSVDYMPEVIAQNPVIVAHINPHMPFTCGATTLPLAAIDYAIERAEPVATFPPAAADPVDQAIARNVAGLIEDGDVLQTGIGALPDAVLGSLTHLKGLGVHTGILTGAWQPLLESGVVDNCNKKQFKGISVTTMAGGDEAFYRYLDRNPLVEFQPCSLTHSAGFLASIDHLCAINSVMQMDLSGRANAESVGGRVISTPGGLPDFAKGARASRGGKSIIALRSTFKGGEVSNILPVLNREDPVSLNRDAIDFVVTEFGVAELGSKSGRALADVLVAVAHPAHRESLLESFVNSI